mmetsp:Transcript_31032/g.89677  ORF Transcript_31032/g.89677 Transcript_31032/m.89677 type:complete len:319 (-) Transcript_31032:57-1013(-)
MSVDIACGFGGRSRRRRVARRQHVGGALWRAALFWNSLHSAAEAVAVKQGRSRRSATLLGAGRQSPIQMLDGDPCFEGKAMGSQLRANAALKSDIVDVYSFIFQTCNEGIHNMQCVSKAQFAQYPKEWLKVCNERMGPQPTSSAAVCSFADQVLKYVQPRALAYTELSELLDATMPACKTALPLPCVVQIEQCIGEPDMRYCFNQCLRSGNMKHALFTKDPPCTTVPTTLPTTTASTTTIGSTTYWWQAAVEVVEGAIGADLDGVKAEEYQENTTVAAPAPAPAPGVVGAMGYAPQDPMGAPAAVGKMGYSAPEMMSR